MDLQENENLTWHSASKLLFRFAFVYFVLYALARPIGIPLERTISVYCNLVWYQVASWVGRHFLGLDYTFSVEHNGSGDKLYDYVLLFSMVLVASLVSLIWSVMDRKRPHYQTLCRWLWIGVRYYLAFVLLTYGFMKVIKAQFPFPDLERLITPYGHSSPMRLLWNFMGYSASYNFFAGMGEVVAGVLLFFRRTVTLGALISVGVLGHVVMLNFSYDVPVKLFSTYLLVLAFALLACDGRRLLNLFVLNRSADAVDLSLPFADFRLRVGRLVLKVFLIAYVMIVGLNDAKRGYERYGDGKDKPVLYGIYDVEKFVQNGEERPPLTTDSKRWKRVIVKTSGYASIQLMNEKIVRYGFEPDTLQKTITMFALSNSAKRYTFDYEQPAQRDFILNGRLKYDSLSVEMKAYDLERFPLINRGFNWITEFPFNR